MDVEVDMRHVLVVLLMLGCGDKARDGEIAKLKEQLTAIETALQSKEPSSREAPTPVPPRASSQGDDSVALVVRAIDAHIDGVPGVTGLKYAEFLDESGHIRDLSLLTSKIRERAIKTNGGEEGAWRGVSHWLGLRATAIIMKNSVAGATTEAAPTRQQVIDALYNEIAQSPAAVAGNLGLKLNEAIAADGSLVDPARVCNLVRNWYVKRGEIGHGTLLKEYGRIIGTGIWTGRICEQVK